MLSLLMLQPALVPSIADAHARSRLPTDPSGESNSIPYLKALGPLPLRFGPPPPPPPDLTSKPPAGAPPLPSAANQAPAADFTPAASAAMPPASAPGTKPGDHAISPADAKPAVTTLSILPDDTHPATRPEDFLPFFQYPGGNGDVSRGTPNSVSRPPSPGQLPPSSATYQQK